MNVYGYARVSSKDQNLDRQLVAINNFALTKGYGQVKMYFDKLSGKNFERPQWQLLKDHALKEGDLLIIKELDRLGRNKNQTVQTLNELKDNGIKVIILDIPTTTMELPIESNWVMDMINNLLIEVLSSIAENERVKIRSRQAEGVKLAHENGVKFGRPVIQFPPAWHNQYSLWKDKEITAIECMKNLELKKTSFYKLVKLHENEHNITLD